MAKRLVLRYNSRPFSVGDARIFPAGLYGWVEGAYASTLHPLDFDSREAEYRWLMNMFERDIYHAVANI